MKICTKCKAEKPLGEFNSKQGRCKDCQREYNQKYYQKTRKKALCRQREYYRKNKEKIRDYQREYYQSNKEKVEERNRAYRRRHKEKYSAYYREYRRRHSGHLSEYQKQYFQTERGKENWKRAREKYAEKNPEKIKARRILNNAVRDGKLERSVFCARDIIQTIANPSKWSGFAETVIEKYTKSRF